MRCLIVGTAKSGTTALLALVGQAMASPRLFVEDPLEEVVPALRAQAGDGVAKVIFGNEPEAAIVRFAEAFDRRVLLLRDPRDQLVSSLLYMVASSPARLADQAFLDRFSALLRAKQADPASVDFGAIVRLFESDERSFVGRVLSLQAAFGRFVADVGAGAGIAWHLVRYEDFVAGRLDALSRYLGRPLSAGVDVPPEYARVARTKSTGDWRHWFTPADVAALRPAYDPLLRSLGYAVEWTPAPVPRIAPEHSWGYLDRLVDERRRHYGLAPRRPAGDRAACNLCGGGAFGPGPAGRTAGNGMPPCCLGCGSLERQRAMRLVTQALPPGFLEGRLALQITRGNGLPETVFRRCDTWAVDGCMDRMRSRDGAGVDLLAFSHLLEYVQDDLDGFDNMMRRLSPRGLLLACFAAPWSRPSTLEPAGSAGHGGPLRLYGRDLARHFRCAQRGLTVLAVEAADPCTGGREVVHLFFKNGDDAASARQGLSAGGGDLRLLSEVGAPAGHAA
ncbi:MAG: hypothetical protein ABW032_12765 [Burkholderiaceae bacterium]